MQNSITRFFDAWQLNAKDARLEKIAHSVTDNIQYDDPRTPQTIHGIEALNDYVGMFSANAPGWSAKVLSTDTVNHMTRATVTFSGAGPDGVKKTQYGQYFIEFDGERISRMVGFAGSGAQE